jgi:nitrogen fixation NifU-like protein
VHSSSTESWEIPRLFGFRECHRQTEPKSSEISSELHDDGALTRMYSPQVLDHFEHPRNAGAIADADARARIENPACGDILEITIKVDEGRIAEIRFRAKGCVAAMACGSALTELMRGKSVDAARRLTREELLRAVGGLPQASSHAGHLAMDALEAVLQQIAKKTIDSATK